MTAYDDPAFREKMKQEYRYQTVNALLSRYKPNRPQPAPASSAWTLTKPVTPPPAAPRPTQPRPEPRPRVQRLVGQNFPTRIAWKTMADWDAYRAKLVDVSELQTFFEEQSVNDHLSPNVRETAKFCAKDVADYRKRAERIKAPENVTDTDDISEVFNDRNKKDKGIRIIIEQKLVKVAITCQKGMSYQTTAFDRIFYRKAINLIEMYLNSICFHKRHVVLNHMTKEEETLFETSDVPTNDSARIGRYSDLLFEPYQARYGDDDDDVCTILGRCTLWKAAKKREGI